MDRFNVLIDTQRKKKKKKSYNEITSIEVKN